MIRATADIETSRLLEYIDRDRHATGQQVTPAHLVGRAAGQVFEASPGLNGRVAFGGFLPSPSILVSNIGRPKPSPSGPVRPSARPLGRDRVKR